MKYYSIDAGENILLDSHMIIKQDENGNAFKSSKGNPVWEEYNDMFKLQSSEKWIEEITAQQAQEIHETFMKNN